jgi:transposase
VEAGRARARRKRHIWQVHRQPFMRKTPHRLVFIDETSVKTNMTRMRGRSLKGQRLRATAPFGYWQTQTFIAGLRCDGLIAPWVLDGPINRAGFEAYVETKLAPALNHGDVVILDNLSSHKSAKAAVILRKCGARFLFLPPYSPDLNPIEMASSKLKANLRRIGARTIDALWRAVGEICDLYDENECWNYFKTAGYAHD